MIPPTTRRGFLAQLAAVVAGAVAAARLPDRHPVLPTYDEWREQLIPLELTRAPGSPLIADTFDRADGVESPLSWSCWTDTVTVDFPSTARLMDRRGREWYAQVESDYTRNVFAHGTAVAVVGRDRVSRHGVVSRHVSRHATRQG